jgi:tripartite ATP-independent transporter DctM subunit
MSLTVIGILGIILLFVLIFANIPIGISLALAGSLGLGVVRGIDSGLSVLGMEYYRTASTYVFSVIPFFIGMGFLSTAVKLSDDAFLSIYQWIGHRRGGLAMAATLACGMFAAVCGDAISTATTTAAVSLPIMRQKKYADVLSLGCLAAGGNLGFLIPPSLGFIFYAILTEQSVGTLFISGIMPGILLIALFLLTIWGMCRLKPELAPPSQPEAWSIRFKSLRLVISSAILIILVLGGIYAGFFTPTEAGAVGILGVLIIGLVKRRLTWHGLTESLRGTTNLVGKIFILVTGALIYSRFITVTEIPLQLARSIGELDLSPYVVLLVVLIFYILIGFIMDIMSIILLAAPILHPILVGVGFDPVWLAAVTMITVLIGHISPPVGIVVYGLSGYVTDVPVFTIFKGALPFIGAMLLCLIILIVFPDVVLWLPSLMVPG